MDRRNAQGLRFMARTDDGTNAMTVTERASPCDGCRAASSGADSVAVTRVDRRVFVTRGAMAAVGALLVTACGGACDSTGVGGGGGNGPLSVTVSNFPGLASVGGIARVDSGQGTPVAAVRTSATTFSAFSLICPHFGCTVEIASGSFACPCHGARFAANGHWTGGQQTGNLNTLTATYDATTGVLTISR